jgi:hypothetical protein
VRERVTELAIKVPLLAAAIKEGDLRGQEMEDNETSFRPGVEKRRQGIWWVRETADAVVVVTHRRVRERESECRIEASMCRLFMDG